MSKSHNFKSYLLHNSIENVCYNIFRPSSRTNSSSHASAAAAAAVVVVVVVVVVVFVIPSDTNVTCAYRMQL